MSASLPDWSDLAVFLATARRGTLGSAASELGVNASTVQRRIARLEDDLGARLFCKGPRGYELTAAGADLLRHAEAMEEEVLSISRRVGGRDGRLEGPVSLSTVDDLGNHVLPPILSAFRSAHPAIEVRLSITDRFVAVDGHESEVALRIGPPPAQPDLVVKRIGHVGADFYASRDYLAHAGTPSRPEDLRQHDLVRSETSRAHFPHEQFTDEHADASRVAIRSNSFLTRMHYVKHGFGVGVLPHFIAAVDPTLVRLDIAHPRFGGELWMLVHVDLRRHARVRALVDHVFDGLLARRALLEDGRIDEPAY